MLQVLRKFQQLLLRRLLQEFLLEVLRLFLQEMFLQQLLQVHQPLHQVLQALDFISSALASTISSILSVKARDMC